MDSDGHEEELTESILKRSIASPLPWPKKGKKAFAASDWRNRTAVDARPYSVGDDDYVAYEFSIAAKSLVEGVELGLIDGGDKNAMFRPVCYLYRHSMEIYLKSIVRSGQRFGVIPKDQKVEKDLGSHNLHALWNHAKIAIESAWPGTGAGDGEVASAERSILEFHELDAGGMGFRYGRDKSGKAHLEGVPQTVDLAHLGEVAQGVVNFLSVCRCSMEGA